MDNNNNSNYYMLEQTLQDGKLVRLLNCLIVAHLRHNNLTQVPQFYKQNEIDLIWFMLICVYRLLVLLLRLQWPRWMLKLPLTSLYNLLLRLDFPLIYLLQTWNNYSKLFTGSCSRKQWCFRRDFFFPTGFKCYLNSSSTHYCRGFQAIHCSLLNSCLCDQ